MAAEIRYKRLPGRLRGIVHTASLWLGDTATHRATFDIARRLLDLGSDR